ncbi:hypothetical protein [Lactobacillus sp.]|uniref:hypothetical protein n=1 Tax=Lactobacillus sp. TaxID=1591 RepID=UPI0019AB7D64|nr:hypothetical protein [Lactobacillus sp.]MBD5429642.1 hypothetical protein [Lactobacillus sp.]
MEIYEKFYKLRTNLGLSQSDIGCNVLSSSSISRIEKKGTGIFTECLEEILKINNISITAFLNEYSTVTGTIRQYQANALYYFFNKDSVNLEKVYENKEINSKLLDILTTAMLKDLSGEKIAKNNKVKKLLFNFQTWNDNFLWCLLVVLRLYQEENFSSIVKPVILKLEKVEMSHITKKLFADVLIAFLLNKGCQRDKSLQDKALKVLVDLEPSKDIFLQKIVGRYLLAEREQNLQEVEQIRVQVSLGNLTREFNQLLNV